MSKGKNLDSLSLNELKELVTLQEIAIIQKDKELGELRIKVIQLEAEAKEILIEQNKITNKINYMEKQLVIVGSVLALTREQDADTLVNQPITSALGGDFTHINCELENHS